MSRRRVGEQPADSHAGDGVEGFRLAGLISLTLAVLLLGFAGAAYAAPTWLPPAPVSDEPVEDTFTIGQQVAFDSQGNALAVWPRSDGPDQVIQASFRPAGGSFGAIDDISDVSTRCDSCGLGVAVEFDAQGNALALWNQADGADQRIYAGFRPAGGSFGEAAPISDAGGDACCPDLALDAQGNALATWGRFDGTNIRVEAAFRPAGGSFGDPETLSAEDQDGTAPSVAFDAQGNALIVWVLRDETTSPPSEIIQAAFRPAGDSFGSPEDLTTSAPACDCPMPTDVAFDAQGNATAVWSRFDGTTLDPTPDGNFRVQAALRPAGGGFATAQDISEDGQDAGQNAGLDVAVDPAGNALAIWTRSDGTDPRVQAAFRPAGGAFATGTNISAAGESACCAQVEFGPLGDAIAVWEQKPDGSNQRIRAAHRPAGGSFGGAEDLSGEGEDDACCPRFAFDGQGNAIVAWSSGDIEGGSQQRVHAAAGYDAAGPQMRGLQFPSSPSHTPLLFSVSPLDVWSPIASTTWSFGDGGTAAGNSVTHAYTRAGSYLASVTSTDAVGNSSTAERGVSITKKKCKKGRKLKRGKCVKKKRKKKKKGKK